MTATADQNANTGIEQLFTGLLPGTDARAFQTPPDAASRQSWKVVSSDGSRSEAEAFCKPPPPTSASDKVSPEISASEASVLSRLLSGADTSPKPRPIGLPQANADVAELASACGLDPKALLERGKEQQTEPNSANVQPASECETLQPAVDPTDAEPVHREHEPVACLPISPEATRKAACSPPQSDHGERAAENYELARVVRAWSQLPPNIRHAILAIIDSL